MSGRVTDIDDSADIVIIGAGAAGATAARWFAEAGRSVVVLEAGGAARSFAFDSADAVTVLGGAGTWCSRGADRVGLVTGACLGGSTAMGYGVMAPLTEAVHASWAAADPGWPARLSYEELELARERVDQDLDITKVPAHHWGTSGHMLRAAFPGTVQPVWRAVNQCLATGRCATGCPTKAIATADRVQLPIAVQWGARVYSNAQVDRVAVRDGRAIGVTGKTTDGGVLRVTAKRAVFLCAGALQSPRVLARSGVAPGKLGTQLHAECLVSGLLPDYPGDQQAAGITIAGALPDVAGVTVAAVSVPPRQRALQLPGVGVQLEDRLDQLDRLVTWRVTLLSDVRGRLRGGGTAPQLNYAVTPADRARLLAAIGLCTDGLLRAGAVEAYPQVAGAPDSVRDPQTAQAIARLSGNKPRVPLAATQFFSGVAVDDRFQAGGIRGLVVADASMLPAHTGGPPLSTIMAAATAVAQRWI